MMISILTRIAILFVIISGFDRSLAFSPLGYHNNIAHTSVKSKLYSSTISTATGEADRAFRLGIQLEKAGLARAASAGTLHVMHYSMQILSCQFLKLSLDIFSLH